VTMCGHGTIAICTVLVETGMVNAVEPQTEIVLDTPAGIVRANVDVKDGRVESVTIRNVPSFLFKADAEVDVPDVGAVRLDIAYGGNFYAILDADRLGLAIKPDNANDFISIGTKIWKAVNVQIEIQHPDEPQIDCINYVEFSGPPTHPQATLKNTVVIPPGGMDRSPCGTGTSAKMAVLHARGKLGLHEEFVHESIIGSLFYGRLESKTKVGAHPAVIPTIRGSAYITGMHQFVADHRDPFANGFQLGKIEKQYGFGFRPSA